MSRLKDKVAIITGGTGGLGRAAVELFIAEGAKLVVADLDSDKGKALQDELGEALIFQHADISRAEDVENLVENAVKQFGGLHVMVNNAAVPGAMHTNLFDEDFSDFDRVMRVNLLGVMLGTQVAARHMAQHGGGSIINTSSISGVQAGYGLPCYRTAKAAVNHFSKSAAIEFGSYGIRVNCIAPGNIATSMNAFSSPDMNADQQRHWDTIRNRIRMAPQPLKRQGSAIDIAEAMLFLASDQSSHITGVVLPVDGGITIGQLSSPLDGDDLTFC